MSDNKNIDPLKDIDFSAMGIMSTIGNEGDDPDTPPATPNPKNQKPDPDPEGEDPAGDDPEGDDPAGNDPDPGADPEGDDPSGDDPDPGDDPDEGDDPDSGDDPDPAGDDPAERTVVSELVELIGFDDINTEEFDDSVEGLGKLTQTLAERLLEQQLQMEYEQLPELKEYREYILNGGDPDKYHEVRGRAIDYESVEIAEDNESQQEQLVRQALQTQEYGKEEIDTIVEKYKAGGILKDQAELALTGLKRRAQKEKEQLTAQQQQLAQQQKQEAVEFWNKVETKVKEEESFRGITIPKKERAPFFEWLSKPVKDGYTARDLKALEMNLEDKIALDYLIYSDFPFDKLIDKKAGTKAASDLRKRLKSSGDPKPRKSSPPKPAGKEGTPSIADLDLM